MSIYFDQIQTKKKYMMKDSLTNIVYLHVQTND